MHALFSNFIPKLSETGKTVKQHSQKYFVNNSSFQFCKKETIIILNRFKTMKIFGFFFDRKTDS